MTNKSKQKGTAWETAIVNCLARLGYKARRVVLHGAQDQGDIHIQGLPIIIEAKNAKTYQLSAWVKEANQEAANANAMFGVVWAHKNGRADPLDGYVIMDGRTFVNFLRRLEADILDV